MTGDDIVAIDETIDEEILTDANSETGTFSNLQNELNSMTPYGTYELTKNYTFDPATDNNYVDGCYIQQENIVIDGKGHALDGNSQAIILNCMDLRNVTLKNIIFKNGLGNDRGGALDVENSPLTIINCTFMNSQARTGGAVFDYGGSVMLGCSFINNSANYSGGAIYGQSILFDCIFINNSARAGGGFFGNIPIMSGCVFINNSATTSGGGVYTNIAEKIENTIFINNFANKNGGGLYQSYSCHFRNLTFINNTALGNGGGAYVGSDFAQYGRGEMFDCTFINNIAYNEGGGLDINILGESDNLVFINNTAGTDGGGVSINSGVLANSFYSNNTAMKGGAVSTHDANLTNSIFTKNTAITGGAVWIFNATIDSCQFSENTATRSGGAIYVQTPSEITNNEFYKNMANNISNDYSSNANLVIKVATDSEIIAHDGSCLISGNKSYSIALKNIKGFSLANKTVNFILGGKNIGSAITNQYGIATITLTEDILKDVKAGVKDLVISFEGDDSSNPITETVKFTIDKENFQIAPTSASYVINYGGTYKATIKDSAGKAIAGEKVTFTLNGKNIGTATTDANGVVSIKLAASILKTAKAGTKDLVVELNDNYNTKTVKVNINKEAVKITAKNKAFKKAVKTKKYTITLKNSKGKAVKKAKVTIKVGKKTYKATTNAKGKATFKITKLTKKGKYTAKITYKTTAYYLKATKKVKITIK